MIELRKVTKRYGRTEALKGVSLTAPDGCVLGLLGVNGAGKTTMLNLMTGYLPPTAGQVLVDGTDMLANPRFCKRRIGYLPEQPPLYDEMTVTAYLTFVSRLREVKAASIPGHVRDILGLCGLAEVADRPLGKLSKGYRQRAGIAQALCGDPSTLIFDEPTVGLDPRQVVEIRRLIRTLGQTHTVIFSSHLLAEVSQLCTRAAILHEGRLVWEDDLTAQRADGHVDLRVVIAGRESEVSRALRDAPGFRSLKALPAPAPGLAEYTLSLDEAPGEPLPQERLFRLLAARDLPLIRLEPEPTGLEDIFLRVTQREGGNA